ncbi:MAG TPA: hypothetical protein VNA69_09995 [Thermoanaerobaculia bacterium]|nr:hypothetical protein [Thermoanaerobaculia bacterium]
MRRTSRDSRADRSRNDTAGAWAHFEDPAALRAELGWLIFVQEIEDDRKFNTAVDEAVARGWVRRKAGGAISTTDLGAAAYETHFGKGADPLDPATAAALRARLAGARCASLPRLLTTTAAFLAQSRPSRAVLLREVRDAVQRAGARWPSKRVALNALRRATASGWLVHLGRGMYQVTPEGIAAERRGYARSALPRKVRRTLPRLVKRAAATTLTQRFTAIGYHASHERDPGEFTLDDLREGYDALMQPWPYRTTVAKALAKAIKRKWIARRARAVYTVTALGGKMVEQRFGATA